MEKDGASELPTGLDPSELAKVKAVEALLPGQTTAEADTLPPDPQGASTRPGAATGPGPGCPSVPGYQILAELGRGGMGVVYQARHLGLNRLVALKMILAGGYAGPEQFARFRAEAEALARLQHPGIVQVFEIGQHDGLPFFSLEFCAGGSLDRRLRGGPLPPQPAAALVEALARAVAAAHRAAVVHRDLKPANVLFAADGTPKVTDFGLAKRLDLDSGRTRSGAVMGTPSYMAPEQARGEGRAVGPAADIYALGAILYECLTGRPPFRAETAFDTIMRVIEAEPVPPSRVGPAVPRDLETICLKCLQKEPARRYPSADELADDLARFRADEPIRGRRVGLRERAWRRVKRNPVLSSLAVAAVGLVTALVAVLAGDRERPAAAPGAAAPAPGPQEDELLTVVHELNRTEPGWRLERLEAARPPVPPGQNSAERIMAARRLLPADWPRRLQAYEKAFGSGPGQTRMGRRQQAALRDLLKAAGPALAEARALADTPRGRHAINYSRDFLTTRMPHAEATRDVVLLLSLDALGQAQGGRLAGALADCRATVNASRSLDGEPAAIAQLVRIAGVWVAVHDAERVLRSGEAPAADVEALQRLLETEAQSPVLLTMARGERGGMHWLMSAATSGDFEGGAAAAGVLKFDPAVAAALKAMPTGLAARHAHAWLLRHLTRFVDIARLPEPRWQAAVREWDWVARTAPNGARQFLPAGPRLVDACLRHRAAVRCAVAALAVERYRLKHDRWPDRLADLVPEGLKQVPVDPYDGRPLRYVRSAGGVTVYAVGPDGKDNGGNLDPANPERAGSDLGFRLWDAAVRHPAARSGATPPRK